MVRKLSDLVSITDIHEENKNALTMEYNQGKLGRACIAWKRDGLNGGEISYCFVTIDIDYTFYHQ